MPEQQNLPLEQPPSDPLGLSNRPDEVTVYGSEQFNQAMEFLEAHGGRCMILHWEKAKGNAVWRLTINWNR